MSLADSSDQDSSLTVPPIKKGSGPQIRARLCHSDS